MILVTGAGGTVGSALLDELSALGHQPRRAFHSPAKTALASADGLDAVTIDFGQPDTLPAAMAGVQTVFLLGTSGPSQPEHEGNMVAAARAAGVRRIVKLSAWRADEDLTPIGRFHHASEQAVRTSGLAWTFLRPNFYLQNFTRRLAASIRDTGGFAQLASDAPIAFVDARGMWPRWPPGCSSSLVTTSRHTNSPARRRSPTPRPPRRSGRCLASRSCSVD
ncbi:SDR family oxidoreductase [Fodinicola feengrottensis]|uniref:SDR family oxidoreductase n=1 Tax=Fodinicola feengrottensis TaxID=435914 RepID=UPI002442D8AF|nr:NAD(P)H-binding protein [Fodinicola feengrottensis]